MNEIIDLLILILGGLLLRYALTLTGQSWAKSYSQTLTFMILPLITFIITKTIVNNIALSLGMIGALSIVRFRHPVKSALELIMYFALITIGIATSVRTKWAIQLIVVIIIIIALSKILQNFFNKNGRSFYTTSFNEGTNLNTIEVFTNEKIELIEKDIHLDSSYNNKLQNEFVYRLAFENKKDLEILKKKIEGLKNISKINTNYN